MTHSFYYYFLLFIYYLERVNQVNQEEMKLRFVNNNKIKVSYLLSIKTGNKMNFSFKEEMKVKSDTNLFFHT